MARLVQWSFSDHFLEVYPLGFPRWATHKALSRLDQTEPLTMFDDALAEAIDGGEVFLCALPSKPTLFIVRVTPHGASSVSVQSVRILTKDDGLWL